VKATQNPYNWKADYVLQLADNMFVTKCKEEKSIPSPKSRTQYTMLLGI
jgi:hypothetical protein